VWWALGGLGILGVLVLIGWLFTRGSGRLRELGSERARRKESERREKRTHERLKALRGPLRRAAALRRAWDKLRDSRAAPDD
jgi:hypothetical protein